MGGGRGRCVWVRWVGVHGKTLTVAGEATSRSIGSKTRFVVGDS